MDEDLGVEDEVEGEDELIGQFMQRYAARLDSRWRPVELGADRALSDVLEKHSVSHLKQMLRRYRLPVQGIKRDLVFRIVSSGAIPTDYPEYHAIVQRHQRQGTTQSYHACVAALSEMLNSVELLSHKGDEHEGSRLRNRLCKLTVKQLMATLRHAKRPVSGLKEDLITRCIEFGLGETALREHGQTATDDDDDKTTRRG